MSHLLSKSKYIRGLQCDRALWLDVHEPRLARYTAEQMRRFDRGRDFEYSFKVQFPDGIDISAELGRNVDAYPELTAQYLDGIHTPSPLRGTPPNLGGELVLFEAGFLYDDVLVLADVVQQREDGSLDIYEVKSGTTLSDTYRRDAALQHYVISHCRRVNSFSIVYAWSADVPSATGNANGTSAQIIAGGTPAHPDYAGEAPAHPNYAGGTPAHPGFAIVDLTAELAAEGDRIAANIAEMKTIVRATAEPDTPTGQHCLEPYACPYQHYCQQGVRQMSLFG